MGTDRWHTTKQELRFIKSLYEKRNVKALEGYVKTAADRQWDNAVDGFDCLVAAEAYLERLK
jgi:hypothetical protein